LDIAHLDGLIVGGGADVDPKLYGQDLLDLLDHTRKKKRSLGRRVMNLIVFPLTWLLRRLLAMGSGHARRDPLRDGLEMRLIHGAVERGLPVLGICRGCQLLNVHFGGSLYQSISGFYTEEPEVRSILPRKRVHVSGGLAKVMGVRPVLINAMHRQAICHLGDGLRVAATDRNGIVQAIEHGSLPFLVGVQWHPEYLPQLPRQRKVFAALVAAARQRAEEGSFVLRYPQGPGRAGSNTQRVLAPSGAGTRSVN
jgi:putative glutamine amidotransferase